MKNRAVIYVENGCVVGVNSNVELDVVVLDADSEEGHVIDGEMYGVFPIEAEVNIEETDMIFSLNDADEAPPIKCNICGEGNMEEDTLLYVEEFEILINKKDLPDFVQKEIEQMILEGKTHYKKIHRFIHIYNCDACPNSQLEYHHPEDANGYALYMRKQFEKEGGK